MFVRETGLADRQIKFGIKFGNGHENCMRRSLSHFRLPCDVVPLLAALFSTEWLSPGGVSSEANRMSALRKVFSYTAAVAALITGYAFWRSLGPEEQRNRELLKVLTREKTHTHTPFRFRLCGDSPTSLRVQPRDKL